MGRNRKAKGRDERNERKGEMKAEILYFRHVENADKRTRGQSTSQDMKDNARLNRIHFSAAAERP